MKIGSYRNDFVPLVVSVLLSSTVCVVAQSGAQQSLGDWLSQQDDLTRFYTILDSTSQSLISDDAGVEDTLLDLAESELRTVFAPTDEAFEKIDHAFATRLKQQQYARHLALIVMLHGDTLNSPVYSNQLFDGYRLFPLFNEDITASVNNSNGAITLQSSGGLPGTVIEADLTLTDEFGTTTVVHKLDSVLLPQFAVNDIYTALTRRTLYNTFRAPFPAISEEFNTLSSLIVTAGLESILTTDSVTLLAPSDEAFSALPESVLSFLTDPDNLVDLQRLLTYHVCPGVYTGLNFMDFDQDERIFLPTYQGFNVIVERSDFFVVYSNSISTTYDLLARNGAVQVLQSVMYTVPQLMLGQPDISIFTGILQDLNVPGFPGFSYFDAFGNPLPWTVFAPVNSAFEALDADLWNRLRQPEFVYHLASLVDQYFTVGDFGDDPILSTDLTEGMVLPDDETETQYTVRLADGRVFLDAPTGQSGEVVEPDLLALNGVVHKVDSILAPFFLLRDIVDQIEAAGVFSTLVSLIEMAGLQETLRQGIFTLLAPTDDAFATLSADTVDFLTNASNVEVLTSVLAYHVIPGVVFLSAGDVEAQTDTPLETLEGSSVLLTIAEAYAEADDDDFAAEDDDDVLVDDDLLAAGLITINGANIVVKDDIVNNGNVHWIDRVLLPPQIILPTSLPTGIPTVAPVVEPDDEQNKKDQCDAVCGIFDLGRRFFIITGDSCQSQCVYFVLYLQTLNGYSCGACLEVFVVNTYQDSPTTNDVEVIFDAASPVFLADGPEFVGFPANLYDIDVTEESIKMTLVNNSQAEGNFLLPPGLFDRYYFNLPFEVTSAVVASPKGIIAEFTTVEILEAGFSLDVEDSFGMGIDLPIAFPGSALKVAIGPGADLSVLGEEINILLYRFN